MGERVSTAQDPDCRDQPVDPGPGQRSRPTTQPQEGATVNIGPILARTVRHFFPDFNDWLDQVHDPRFQPRVTYGKRYLLWSGLMLFVCKLGSRRQVTFQFNQDSPGVLDNLNRLADTNQVSCPVDKTLEYFLRRSGSAGLVELRHQVVNRLIRMRALEQARLQGRAVILIDATGYLVFNHRHCEHCLTQRHDAGVVYQHQVLEAKLLGPGGTVFSIATEFIDNRDLKGIPDGTGAERIKQDCELKALRRLLGKLRAEYPQLRICLNGDSLYACGEGFQLAKDFRCDYLYVFKEGRTPALWADFQGLLRLCPDQRVEATTPAGVRQIYRWVNGLEYTDSDGREWVFNAIECIETKNEKDTRWAWVTPLEVNHQTVQEVAGEGGRQRWREENEGFNIQKNSNLNLEHVYSHKCWEAYYYLLQIAHILLQLVEKGSLLLGLARQQGKKTAVALFGSLMNMAGRLLESLRTWRWPDEAFATDAAARIQIRINTS